MHLYMIVEPMTPYPARGYSRLPVSRGGSAHTPGRKRDAMPRTTLMTTSQLARFIAVSTAIVELGMDPDRLWTCARRVGPMPPDCDTRGSMRKPLKTGLRMEGSGLEAGADRQRSPGRRAVGPLSCAQPTVDRPCRLSLADPALCRSQRRAHGRRERAKVSPLKSRV